MTKSIKPRHNNKKKWPIVAVASVMILLGIFFAWKHYNTDTKSSTATTTSTNETAQSDYSQGTDKQTPASNDIDQGGANDTKGNDSSSQRSAGVKSDSGNIVVFKPTSGATLAPGSVVSGTAKVDTVYFRLVDDSVGVIAQGPLSVVDGKFSGKLQFTAHGSSGVIKVYSLDGSGLEINRVSINVSY